jgi:uncharacterized protein YdcH (DUF465 family)
MPFAEKSIFENFEQLEDHYINGKEFGKWKISNKGIECLKASLKDLTGRQKLSLNDAIKEMTFDYKKFDADSFKKILNVFEEVKN